MRAILGLVPPGRGTFACWARRRRAATPPSDTCRRFVARSRRCGSAAGTSSPAPSMATAWASRSSARRAGAEVDRVLDLVGARDLARRPLAETSGGERQRLLLAQTLIGRPRLLLLDEPLISLDPAPPARGGGAGEVAAGRAWDRRAVQRARAEPAAGRAGPGAVSRQRPGGAGHGRGGHHRAGAVAAVWVRHRRRALRRPHLRDVRRPRHGT